MGQVKRSALCCQLSIKQREDVGSFWPIWQKTKRKRKTRWTSAVHCAIVMKLKTSSENLIKELASVFLVKWPRSTAAETGEVFGPERKFGFDP